MSATNVAAACRRGLLAGGLAIAVIETSGCSSIIPGADRDPPQLFDLSPKSTFPPGLPKVRWQLIIETPVAAAGLSSSRIALKRQPLRLEYYAKTTWTDLAPKMVQNLIVESFENSGKIVAIGRESAGLRSDFVLKTELREFQAEYISVAKGGAPKVRVRINAKLVLMPERTIVASKTFEKFIIAESISVSAIVQAYDRALGKTLKSLVVWTLRTGYKAWRRRPRDSRRRRLEG